MCLWMEKHTWVIEWKLLSNNRKGGVEDSIKTYVLERYCNWGNTDYKHDELWSDTWKKSLRLAD